MDFKIDKKWWPKRNFIERWAAKIVAKMMLNRNTSYQCCGVLNWVLDYEGKADIQVSSTQMAFWILREAGFDLCEKDLERLNEEDV